MFKGIWAKHRWGILDSSGRLGQRDCFCAIEWGDQARDLSVEREGDKWTGISARVRGMEG